MMTTALRNAIMAYNDPSSGYKFDGTGCVLPMSVSVLKTFYVGSSFEKDLQEAVDTGDIQESYSGSYPFIPNKNQIGLDCPGLSTDSEKIRVEALSRVNKQMTSDEVASHFGWGLTWSNLAMRFLAKKATWTYVQQGEHKSVIGYVGGMYVGG